MIRCNGCAWGLVCERRQECAHHEPAWPEFKNNHGAPSLEDSRQGWTLFACAPGRFEHFEPVPGADLA